MGASVPPLPPPPEVVKERIRKGARTMREIDPEFAKWVDQQNRLHLIHAIALVLAVPVLLLLLIYIFAIN